MTPTEWYQKNKKRVAERTKARIARNPEAFRRVQRSSRLKRAYGIPLSMYEGLYEAQKGQCSICKKVHSTLQIDHAHDTGAIRGLLCGFCNRGIGLLKDSPELLAKAAEYVQQRSQRSK